MARFEPTDVLAAYASIAPLNANFDAISLLLDKAVMRDGTSPNSMLADLDFNHYKLRNLGDATDAGDAVPLYQLLNYINGIAVGGTIHYPSVDALQAVEVDSLTPALVSESGRAGFFVFVPSDLTARVTADTLGGVVIAPDSDPTGASGAWVRQFSGAVDPKWFGLKDDGTVNPSATLAAALNWAFDNGLSVDGGTNEYLIDGNTIITGKTRPSIQQLRIRQSNPSTGRNTLKFLNCQQIQINNLHIDVGSSQTLGEMNGTFGLLVDGGSKHNIRNVTATGNGKLSYVAFWNCTDSLFDNIRVYDGVFNDAAAVDDVVQGIWTNVCVNCTLSFPKVHSLTGNAKYPAGVGPTYAELRTRGIVVTGCENLTIEGPSVRNVDQAIDVTGSAGNRKVIVVGGRSYECGSVGVKLANSAVDCKVVAHIGEKCGFHAFLASGPAEAGLTYKTMDCEFIACKAINTGWNGIAFTDKSGFMIRVGDFDIDYPKGIRFIDCESKDTQGVPTTKYGFYNEGIAYDNTMKRRNEVVNCKSYGHTTVSQAGFHRPIAYLGSTAGNLTVTTGSGGAVDLTWDNESAPYEDSMNMHAASASTIVAPVTGFYKVDALVMWNSTNATGYRRTYLFQNAAELTRIEDIPSATVNTYNRFDRIVYLTAGDALKLRVEHTAGVDTTVARGGSYFRVELVREN